MRLIVQRVSEASVQETETAREVGKIDKGLFILVGVANGDTTSDAEILAEKVGKLRIMADASGKMNLSVKDINASVLVVSQFTLYADTKGGNRPSFVKAADPSEAIKIYDHFIVKLQEKDIQVRTGSFGNYMTIEANLDGPVTIIMES